MQSDAEAGAEAHEGREVGAQHLRQVQSRVPAYETGAILLFSLTWKILPRMQKLPINGFPRLLRSLNNIRQWNRSLELVREIVFCFLFLVLSPPSSNEHVLLHASHAVERVDKNRGELLLNRPQRCQDRSWGGEHQHLPPRLLQGQAWLEEPLGREIWEEYVGKGLSDAYSSGRESFLQKWPHWPFCPVAAPL